MTTKPKAPDLEFASAPTGLELADAPAVPTVDDATRAVVAHLVEQQTTQLRTELASAQDQITVLTAARDTAVAELESARADLTARTAELEQANAVLAEQRLTARIAEAASAAPSLTITDAHRARFGSQTDEEFASYLEDLRSASAPAGQGAQGAASGTGGSTFTAAAGETAMATGGTRTASTGKAPGRTVLGLK